MKFTVPSIRIPSKKNSYRIALNRRTGSRFLAPSAALRRAEEAIGYSAKVQGVRPVSGPVRLAIGISGKRGAWDLTVEVTELESGRIGRMGDVEGMSQTIMDALNGIAYEDDGQVCELIVKRESG